MVPAPEALILRLFLENSTALLSCLDDGVRGPQDENRDQFEADELAIVTVAVLQPSGGDGMTCVSGV